MELLIVDVIRDGKEPISWTKMYVFKRYICTNFAYGFARAFILILFLGKNLIWVFPNYSFNFNTNPKMNLDIRFGTIS